MNLRCAALGRRFPRGRPREPRGKLFAPPAPRCVGGKREGRQLVAPLSSPQPSPSCPRHGRGRGTWWRGGRRPLPRSSWLPKAALTCQGAASIMGFAAPGVRAPVGRAGALRGPPWAPAQESMWHPRARTAAGAQAAITNIRLSLRPITGQTASHIGQKGSGPGQGHRDFLPIYLVDQFGNERGLRGWVAAP